MVRISKYLKITIRGLFAHLGLHSSCSAGKLQFRKILNSSAKNHIPNITPNFTEITSPLLFPHTHIYTNSTHKAATKLQIPLHRNGPKPLNHAPTNVSSRLWGILKSPSGKRTKTPPNQPITFSSKSLTRKGEIATALTKQFISPVPSDPSARIVRRKLLKECPLDSSVSRFSPHIVSYSIKNSGWTFWRWTRCPHHTSPRKPRPFKTSIPHPSFQPFTQLLQYPRHLEKRIITPVPKPFKPVYLGTSYRPITHFLLYPNNINSGLTTPPYPSSYLLQII